MKRKLLTYSVKSFNEQLKRIRIYRGYKTQATLCTQIGVSRQVWSLWEKGKRNPSIENLTELATILQIDINYFFVKNADPENYDFTIDRVKEKLEQDFIKDKEDSLKLMPFIETSVSNNIFRLLDLCRTRKGIFTVDVFSECGNTRAILEYLRINPENLTLLDEKDFSLEKLNNSKDTVMIIADDADKLSDEILNTLINQFAKNFVGSIVLFGRSIKETLKSKNWFDKIDEDFQMDCITIGDFEKIVKMVFTGADAHVINYLKMETGIRLNRLYMIAKQVKEMKNKNSGFSMCLKDMIELLSR